MSKTLTMDELLAGSEINGLTTGEVVEGTVTAVKKNEVWIDLGAQGVGVVHRVEGEVARAQEGAIEAHRQPRFAFVKTRLQHECVHDREDAGLFVILNLHFA